MDTRRQHTLALGAYRPGDKASEAAAGAAVDALIATLVPTGSRVAIRALSMYDHPDMSTFKLAETIVRSGTDRYDPARIPVQAAFYDPWGVDLYAVICWAGPDGILTSHHYPDSTVAAGLMRDFQQGPPVDRDSVPLRVDLLTVYDSAALEPIPVLYADGVEDDRTAFRFRTPAEAPDAVLAVVILTYSQ